MENNKIKEIDLTSIKPYGDTLNDGKIQFSFTLPVENSDEAKEAGKRYLENIGFTDVMVTHTDNVGKGYTFIVAYGVSQTTLDFTKIEVPKATSNSWNKYQVIDFVENTLKKEVKIVGACIESDAHTVGIDAILNMKGYDGHKGLESYHGLDVYNMGAQVACEDLIAKVRETDADAILISQIVTQKDIHIKNMTKLVELLEAEDMRKDIILVAGGPRISHELALELGYDAGFSTGTFPEDVATYIVQQIAKKQNISYEEPKDNH